MAGRRTGRPPASRPEWSDVRDVLHLRLKDAAAALNASTIYLRHLCHQNGFPRGWPGKKVRPGAREIDRSTTTSNSSCAMHVPDSLIELLSGGFMGAADPVPESCGEDVYAGRHRGDQEDD